jgi:hypothetical protein
MHCHSLSAACCALNPVGALTWFTPFTSLLAIGSRRTSVENAYVLRMLDAIFV